MTEAEIKALIDGMAPPIKAYIDRAIADVVARVAALDVKQSMSTAAEAAIVTEIATVRERMAVLETRAPVPGPAGKDGAPGRDGKDGAPGLRYAGVYQDGKAYGTGDVVTWGGSMWHCHEHTDTKPGDGSKAWQLIVKRGRDGRDAPEIKP